MTHTVPSPASGHGRRALTTRGRSRLAAAELAARRPETFLLIRLLIEDPGAESPALIRRLAGQLRLCADVPEIAEALGCDAANIEPGLMRAAAALLSDAARA